MRQDAKYAIYNRVTFQWFDNIGNYTRDLNKALLVDDVKRIHEFLQSLRTFGYIIDLSQLEIQKYKATYVFDSKTQCSELF